MNLQYSQAGAIMTQRTDDVGKLILRLGVGGLMFFHGLAKTRDPSFVIDTVTDAGLPGWIGYSVFLGEIVAPLLLIIGLFTRAAIMSIATSTAAAIRRGIWGGIRQLLPNHKSQITNHQSQFTIDH